VAETCVRAAGRVPNLYATLAQAPAALTGYLDLRAALTRGALPPVLRELLALLVAEANHCDYCVAAHTFRGGKMGLPAEDLAAARRAEARDPKTAAALRFARAVSEARGRVTDTDLADARAVGWRDDELLEVVAHVALNAFSNYVNHVAQPELDFPPAP
jgi:uncharacterized peroxidase-related enzyme